MKTSGADAARTDRVVFYASVVSSFLETSVPMYTRELRVMFAPNADVLEWLDATWEPEESGHGRMMREYVERTWPEYRWEDAYSAFLSEYRMQCGPHLLRTTPAREMLARCVTECQAAMLYRTLASYAVDPAAQALFSRMYADEVGHYKVFLSWFRHYRCAERLGALEILGAMMSRRDKAQAEDAGTALKYVNYGYSRALPFEPLAENGVLGIARESMRAHFPVDTARRMMGKPLEIASPAGRLLARLLGLAIAWEMQPVV
jgi:hypothetical protein